MGALKKPYKKFSSLWTTPTLLRNKSFVTRDPGVHNGDLQSFQSVPETFFIVPICLERADL